jgi:hypothetical protein
LPNDYCARPPTTKKPWSVVVVRLALFFTLIRMQVDREQRFLLIIVGDGESYYSAPLDCKSVANVKREMGRARSVFLERVPDVGVGFLALMLSGRLNGKVGDNCVGNARQYFDDVTIGNDEPALTDTEKKEFSYEIDARAIIDDEEFNLWRDEQSKLELVRRSRVAPLYEVLLVRDCC